MSLAVSVHGGGPSVVLLHGWGLHGGVWRQTAEALASRYRVFCVDLPGFGRSPMPQRPYTLAALAATVAEAVPADAVWVGWSLGGLIALQAAVGDLGVGRLALVGTTPRFVRGHDWADAVAEATLREFGHALKQDFRTTVQRFLALQARGSERAREELRHLREVVFAPGEPAPQALAEGLELLRGSDLRPLLAQIRQPVAVVHGERDMLVPLPAAERLAAALPAGRLAVIPGAGHAPFLSHPEAFHAALAAFLDG